AYTDPGELPQLRVSGEAEPLPLEHTAVNARARGHVAEVRVTQRFRNDRDQPIEVIYTFPLPENAAVDDMRMVIGKRVIESEVQTRARARDTYETARADGHTAALLEQERPNIFTQSVANIAPGEVIEVELHYLQTLTQDAGVQEFVFPMVVGPRFIPGEAIGVSGTGTYADTDRVPDASRITPPIVGEGQRSGNDVSLTLEVDAGHSIDKWTAPTHTVVGAASKQGFTLRLADAETIPNRDFVLRWQVASAQPSASLFLGPKDAKGRGHFALVVQPPQLDLDALVGRREMIFVIDVSGSMSGIPLALAKQTLREALPRMRPVDTFDIVSFESGTQRLFGEARPANLENLVLAERFIDGLQAGGGTQMASAVDAALSPALYEGVHRYVFFLTDGYIGNETEIFAGASSLIERAQQAGGRARVFGLGIGSSPNRELIAGLSRAGDGAPLYLSNREHPTEVVEEYYHWVDHPVLEDLRVDWGGLKVESIYPSAAPDLFASHAVVFHGRYEGKVNGDVEVHARVPGKRTAVELAVDVSASKVDDRILSTLWAREQISQLTTFTWDGSMDAIEVERAITELGLEYHLVTAYTSLVAVDRSRVVGDGSPLEVVMPVEVPEDVDALMAGSRPADRGANYYRSMQSLESQAKELADVERSQEQERRKRLLELEQQAAEAIGRVVAIGDVSVSANLDAAKVAEALRGQQDALLRCLDGVTFGWTLRYRLELGRSSKFARVDSGSAAAPESEELDACIEQSLRAIDWSGWEDGGAVVIEFDLSYM
ncbi:MAG TPA: VIT and VWA domain-containing protein, partial [Enhygromyxa sp.]|nr:VIT and VWA domain-containing protein [Enhygromyxa sp.]